MRQNINAVIGSLLKSRQDKTKKNREREMNALPHHLCLKPIDKFPEFRQKKYHAYTGEKLQLVKEDQHQALGHLVMAAAGIGTLSKVNSFAESREDSLDGQSVQTEGTLEHRRYPLNKNDSDTSRDQHQNLDKSRFCGMGSSYNDSLSLGDGQTETDENRTGEGKNDNESNETDPSKSKKDEISYALIYVGLVILSTGCVFSFVGLGEKGFKTLPVWAIGPTCIFIGLLMIAFKVSYCFPSLQDLRDFYAKNKRIRPQGKEQDILSMAEQGMAGKMPNGGPPPNLGWNLNPNQNQSSNLPSSSKSISTIEITSPPMKKVVLQSPTKIIPRTPRPMLQKSPQFQRGTYDIFDDEMLTRSYVSEIPFGSSSHYPTQQNTNQNQNQHSLHEKQQQSTGPQMTRQYRIPQIID